MPDTVFTTSAQPAAIEKIASDSGLAAAVRELRSTSCVWLRANAMLARARNGESAWFTVNDAALTPCATLVANLTRKRFPDLKIPYHSRWRHFEAGGRDRLQALNHQLMQTSPQAGPAERARTHIDLAVVSVLLDAGAGPTWRFNEAADKTNASPSARQPQQFSRSEGLGVACFHAFMSGLFSSDKASPLQADAKGLQRITADQLAAAFQVTDTNPLVGLEGRAALLRRLGHALADQPELFGHQQRPGHLFDRLAHGKQTVLTHDILSFLLTGMGSIWPAQNTLEGIALGDCWRHPAARSEPADSLSDGWMPFHKLSQWLTYSLLEPFEWAGVQVTGLDALTGLPEYRNGGLFMDAGVLVLRDERQRGQLHSAGDEIIVEWRALTVALLDELAPLVREQLKMTQAQMPLACILEGGTWAAGRLLAQQLRQGLPPLNIQSDGTVF